MNQSQSTLTVAEAWDKLTQQYGVEHETLQIITSINGYSVETLEDVLYAIAGYHSFEQADGEA